MTIAGYCTFPGINQVISADFTLSHGITPSICTMRIVPQANLPFRDGTLTFTYGGQRIEFPQCKVDSAQVVRNQSGQVITLSIMDRRWRWAYGEIAGVYNDISTTRGDANRYKRERESAYLELRFQRSARQLVEMCLKVMGGGERGYDISKVPNDTYPPTVWDGAQNAAQSMQMLLDPLGLRVVLNLNNTVSIVEQGKGTGPPNGAIMEDSGEGTPITVPSQIQLVCGKSRFQNDLPLAPVGLDFDPATNARPTGGDEHGVVKHINALSYKPADGWGKHNPYNFNALSRVPQGPDRKSARDLATSTVWRWYKIFSVTSGRIDQPNRRQIVDLRPNQQGVEIGFTRLPTYLPGYNGDFRSAWQILPLQDEKLEVYAYDGGFRPRPSEVWGHFYIRRYLPVNWNISQRLYFGGYGVDTKRGIVQFGEPMYLNKGTAEYPRYGAAAIRLTCTYNVRDIDNWAHHRYSRSVRVPGGDSSLPAKVITQDEIEYQVITSWADRGNAFQVFSIRDNQASINSWIDYYLSAELRKLQNLNQRQIKYVGLLPINLNGYIQQVTWSVGPQGATTKCGLNTEYSIGQPKYEVRRFWENFRNDRFRMMLQHQITRERLRFNQNNP